MGYSMKVKLAMLALALATVSFAAQVQAAGCLKGAVVGGVAGHYVGKGHAVLGAAGGCIVGHHIAAKKAKEVAVAREHAQQAPSGMSGT
jgi:outer membrane lipoprotein SlyB